eukprot:gb/GECG01013544.1/.p1 GENE.gb/GECG01013544.1/~~gb/GECG01013544.1/.p1  ORF type:complete len:238 (+),score=13.48 gb/GECG01013544.1/:1-714(+)
MKSAPVCIALLAMLLTASSASPLRRRKVKQGPSHPPVWPDSFYISFTETNMIKEGPSGGQVYYGAMNTGDLYYDYTNKLQRIDRSSGLYNGFCNSVQFGDATPCNNYVVNGTRYLSWPERHFCCKCCTEEEGCGMLKPTWIQDAGGSYLGVYSVDYTYVDSWIIHGNEDNYWYQNATDGVPIQLVQGNDVNYYNPQSFKVGPIPPSTFTLPPCDRSCADVAPKSVCAQLSGKKPSKL